MRKAKLAVLAGVACALAAVCVAGSHPAAAQGAGISDVRHAGTMQQLESSAQLRRRRAPTQLRVTRQRIYLPPTAVRACDAWYGQEFRPSGTVIVPRMRCRWVAG
jgi:hypothetical protein